ncbi:uncharacterized protein A1O9_07595 [Exophiala aquamarina CBS 119918]|uniref:NB-ARC domain-containing protein n=1 Tax=Exophiala aquamarina CBS 119918 TaxID=1182545 RepID=A0A072PKF9_9EURO|nr:uncharacterized protein A1O9_07595 [Exophiala aquamarina CBS 119918]KEF56015.1 hypothetical protein A1O9_07595 [Exophiala aquamarina CBS 119918]
MPEMGKVSAATVAAGLRSSFKRITAAFIVGICGAAPFRPDDQTEIIFGDIVLSETLVQYDLGRQYHNIFQSKATLESSLARPGSEIRSLLAKLKVTSNRLKIQHDILPHIAALRKSLPRTRYPGAETDRFYQSSYIHKHRTNPTPCAICESALPIFCPRAAEADCNGIGCESNMLAPRQRLSGDQGVKFAPSVPTPQVHLGRIGSADTVMKSAEHRDRVAKEFGLVAFEMEGAGAWDLFQNTLVIKGVCDYADSHKNKRWQWFAAATAASCLKALLNDWDLADQVASRDSSRSTEGEYYHLMDYDYWTYRTDSDVRRLVPKYLDHHFNGEWLMILDNADDTNLWSTLGQSWSSPDNLVDCLPKGLKGSILVTTRNRQIATTLAGRYAVEILEMEFDQAEDILRNQLISTQILSDTSSSRKLLEMLTCLPLAIVQCASYINRNNISVKTYLQLLNEPEDEVIELLSKDFNDEGHQNPIATTWLLSFNQIREQDPDAAQYPAFIACIGEKNIP